jgi:Family of unknown function (DUF5995)
MRNIESVIQELEFIVNQSITESKRYGYFASLYLEMTKAVQKGIVDGKFEDPARMEKLDVIFADRYIGAFRSWSNGQACTLSWKLAFEETNVDEVATIQHILLGINAHINLDLGIAAAETMLGEDMDKLKNDFDTINTVIAELTEKFQEKLNKISWPLRFLDRIGKGGDEKIADFSISLARKGAWKSAKDMSNLTGEALLEYIQNRDAKIVQIARKIARPGFFANLILKPAKWFEPSNVGEILILLKDS